ncbi:hypothetical protein V1506DRAFT_465926, partial [Lipomyces tetrasporus]
MFIEVFLCSLTVFYSDALPSLLTTVDMTIDKMFSSLTHFRMQRQTTTVTDAVYSAETNVSKTSSETGYKSNGNKKKFKARKLSRNGVSKDKPKCSHCGKRNHEAKDCRVRKYQLRQVQLMQQQ